MMAAGLAALTLSGCASNDPAPLEQMRLTEQALEQARRWVPPTTWPS